MTQPLARLSWLVSEGWAPDYPRYPGGEYQGEQGETRQHNRGMWRGEFVRPWTGGSDNDPRNRHWRTANILVERYGEDALLEAAKQADGLLEKDDMAGCRAWQSITRLRSC